MAVPVLSMDAARFWLQSFFDDLGLELGFLGFPKKLPTALETFRRLPVQGLASKECLLSITLDKFRILRSSPAMSYQFM